MGDPCDLPHNKIICSTFLLFAKAEKKINPAISDGASLFVLDFFFCVFLCVKDYLTV